MVYPKRSPTSTFCIFALHFPQCDTYFQARIGVLPQNITPEAFHRRYRLTGHLQRTSIGVKPPDLNPRESGLYSDLPTSSEHGP